MANSPELPRLVGDHDRGTQARARSGRLNPLAHFLGVLKGLNRPKAPPRSPATTAAERPSIARSGPGAGPIAAAPRRATAEETYAAACSAGRLASRKRGWAIWRGAEGQVDLAKLLILETDVSAAEAIGILKKVATTTPQRRLIAAALAAANIPNPGSGAADHASAVRGARQILEAGARARGEKGGAWPVT